MEKLKELFSKCQSTIEISYNQHKSYYDTIEDNIGGDLDEVDKDILEEMKKRDTLIRIQFYPHSSVGFYTVYHYDFDLALDKALSLLKD